MSWSRFWPPALAVLVVVTVGAPAAVASYRHARSVVEATGDPVMAPWLPLSVDGMLVAALVVIWVRRHRGDAAGVWPWCAFGFGLVVTILANLAAVTAPSVRAVAVALFPPIALAVTLELVALVAYRTRTAKPPIGGFAGPRPVEPGPGENETHPDAADRAGELITAGAGRRRLARELDISEHQARELLAQRRNGQAVTS